jgi:hypothetical protein
MSRYDDEYDDLDDELEDDPDDETGSSGSRGSSVNPYSRSGSSGPGPSRVTGAGLPSSPQRPPTQPDSGWRGRVVSGVGLRFRRRLWLELSAVGGQFPQRREWLGPVLASRRWFTAAKRFAKQRQPQPAAEQWFRFGVRQSAVKRR